jgi:VPDSG-CTERM motif
MGTFGPNFQFGPASVPDTGSTLSLLGFASLGLVALRRKLRC